MSMPEASSTGHEAGHHVARAADGFQSGHLRAVHFSDDAALPHEAIRPSLDEQEARGVPVPVGARRQFRRVRVSGQQKAPGIEGMWGLLVREEGQFPASGVKRS